MYYAREQKDFIFKEEFNEILSKMPSITIEYIITKPQEKFNEERVINTLQSQNTRDVYICGPEGFKVAIIKALKSINFAQDKIHIEEFLHAGEQSNIK